MAKNKKTTMANGNVTVERSHKAANIAVIIIVSLAVLILVAVAVLNLVHVDPVDKLAKPERYDFYDVGSGTVESGGQETQSRVDAAVNDMKFSVMDAVLQWKFGYDYTFKRNGNGDKYAVTSGDIKALTGASDEYMVEFVYKTVVVDDGVIDYSTAQSVTVEGETVYFDRVKVLIGNSNGEVGTISLYPYLSVRIDNSSDIDGLASDTYEVTGINMRANTTTAYAALKELAEALKI